MRTMICLVAVAVALAACKKEAPQPPGTTTEAQKPQAATPAASPQAAGEQGAQEKQPTQPKNPMEEMGKAMQQLANMGKAMQEGQQGKVEVVNWRALAPIAPDQIGDFKADGDLKGGTRGMGAMQHTEVKRRYKAGEKELQLKIHDTSMIPMMRAAFTMAQNINEDTTSGLKRGTKVLGHPAILEWKKETKRGKLSILVAGRFVVSLRLTPSTNPEEVLPLAKSLKLDELAKLGAGAAEKK